ncbi:MAG: glycosyltransferase family 4 protein [Kiritimatiellae bacterium]|nr:glycosyltransferase family 4 protein [Kiritimatiellia bacterium]
MKILQVLPSLQTGGVERGTLEIAHALKEAGIPGAVASQGGPMTEGLEAMGVPHFTLPLASKNPLLIRRNAFRLAELVRKEGFTLMHVRSRAPAWSVHWASKMCGVPWIATFHGVYGTSPSFLKIPYNRIMLKGLRTICVSEYVRKHVIETYRPDTAKLVCIPRGADTDFFRPDAVSPDVALAKKTLQYRFAPETPVITLPGRLTRWKGQTVFIEALSKMRHRRVGALILGSDQGRFEYSEHLREMASRLSEDTRVVFRDYTREIHVVYALSDIVVNASSEQPEAFGRTIPEAQAMGKIVVATAHGGACETIEDGKTGFLVPPGDASAMAEKLDEILDSSPEKLDAIRAAAVESVRAKYSVEKMCESTIALYRELA